MKIAIINFSGNVGKTTIARHLLAPRIKDVEIVSVESANADEQEIDALRGKDFAHLQQYMLASDNLLVDIGASNVEDLLVLMRKFKGSHEDFDYFVVPAVPDVKQQKDTANTAEQLVKMGVPPARIKIVLNRVEDTEHPDKQFAALVGYLAINKVATLTPGAFLSDNEIYQRLKSGGLSITELASDKTDYKALIAKAASQDEKLALADQLAVKRLATGVLPELDACFKALALK
jgi:MinD-like ATPase involved in chromosome partitioning or flagellar assembly